MDYTNAPNNVLIDGKRQFADRDRLNGVPGTTMTAQDANDIVNSVMYAQEQGGIAAQTGDKTGLMLAIKRLSILAPFDADLAKAIGGYPKYALVASADPNSFGLLWSSTVDNNQTVPGADGAAWQKFGLGQFVKQGWGFPGLGSNNIFMGLRTDGSGAIGVGVDETDMGNIAIQGKGRLAYGGWSEEYYTPPSQGNHTVSLQFDAPLAGYVMVIGSANFAAQNSNQTTLSISVNGKSLSADNVTGTTAMSNHSCIAVDAGAVTVAAYLGTSATNPPNVGHTLSFLYMPG
ncbi:hypothetical protein AD945_01205 [Gluconobacter albidus]|uniref:Tail fiber protein n=1 Tax=Gluconobacter albidus TaxID=318683 RepID=A0A149TN61_9PROT|nr:hypothetical protein [Gluconobacter albidus]KXV50824.1 hypothetical protein AD945_01205 [Gluconobacter albidus]